MTNPNTPVEPDKVREFALLKLNNLVRMVGAGEMPKCDMATMATVLFEEAVAIYAEPTKAPRELAAVLLSLSAVLVADGLAEISAPTIDCGAVSATRH